MFEFLVGQLYVFLALFTFVSFLEAIGSTYLVTAVQNIERQFQIPSRVSGFLISTHDISYVLLVIPISYYGSRRNRAKWIGFGTLLIALSQLLTASPNFIFPVVVPQLNLSQVEARLKPAEKLFKQNVSIRDYFDYSPIRDRIPMNLREHFLARLEYKPLAIGAYNFDEMARSNYTRKNFYALDEPLVSEILNEISQLIRNTSRSTSDLVQLFRRYVENRQEFPETDLKIVRRAAIAPFAFCNRLINDFRTVLMGLKCNRSSSGIAPLMVIFIAMLLMGVGRTMPWSLGIPLIDDNVDRKKMPIYFALISSFKILGPICGFLIGALVNKIYYTFPVRAPRGLSPQDPTWIGAWWLGFLFIGLVKIIPSIFLFFFPEGSKKKSQTTPVNSNDSAKVREDNVENWTKSKGSQMIKEKRNISLFDKHIKKNENGNGINAFAESYKEVLHSKVYVGVIFARICDILAFKGYMVFLPKFLENHFGIPQYQVHIYMAFFGIITRKLKLNGRKAAIYVIVVSIFNISLFFAKNFIGCHSIVNSIGLTGVETNFNYTRTCNVECSCSEAKLFPVCDRTGQVFYSPCHAGCRHVTVTDLDSYKLEFAECECAVDGVVKRDFCHDNCYYVKYLFFVAIIMGSFAAGTGVVPGMLLLLRKFVLGPALGLHGFLVSLFGTLPSPILWGFVIDSACLVWERNPCFGKGSCQIYDATKLRVRMHTLYALIRMVSLFADIYVAYHAKGLNLQEEEEEIEEQVEKAVGQEIITMAVIPQ